MKTMSHSRKGPPKPGPQYGENSGQSAPHKSKLYDRAHAFEEPVSATHPKGPTMSANVRGKDKQQFIDEYRRDYGGARKTNPPSEYSYSRGNTWNGNKDDFNEGYTNYQLDSTVTQPTVRGGRGRGRSHQGPVPSNRAPRPPEDYYEVPEAEAPQNGTRGNPVPRGLSHPPLRGAANHRGNGRGGGKVELRQSNMRFRDFSDSRLFNPYESDLGGDNGPATTMQTSSSLPSRQRNEPSMSSSTRSPAVQSIDSGYAKETPPPSATERAASHSPLGVGVDSNPVHTEPMLPVQLPDHPHHGGLIHLPKNVQLFPSSSGSPAPAESVPSQRHVVKGQSPATLCGVMPIHPGYMMYPPRGPVPPQQSPFPRPPHVPPPQALLHAPPVNPPVGYFPPPHSAPPRVPLVPGYPPPFPAAMLPPGSNFSASTQNALLEIQPLEMNLAHLLSQAMQPTLEKWWRNVQEVRTRILALYQNVILSELEYCNVMTNLEVLMWKSSFHAVVEVFRTLCSEPEEVLRKRVGLPAEGSSENGISLSSEVERIALAFIEESQVFINDCIKRLSEMYSVRVYEAMNSNYTPLSTCLIPPTEVKKTSSRTRKLVYFSAQKFCVFYGDLARYRESIMKRYEFGEARKWYLRAQVLEPRNGSPYNQLAVLAHCAKRYLDAVYYYMRSLAATNPSHTPSQMLGTLFEDVRRTAEHLTRARKNSLKRRREAKLSAMERHQTRFGNESRLEIWTHPKGGNKVTTLVEEEAEEREDYSNMAFVDLHKKFTISFMHCHAKLFTKIGMEAFPEVCASMLQEFRGLLCRTPLPFTGDTLCHLLLMNAFEIHRAAMIGGPATGEGGTPTNGATDRSTAAPIRSQLQEQVCRMGLDMFALLCERAVELIRDFREPPQLPLPEDLRALLQAIRLWSDWMIFHSEQWNPPPAGQDPITTLCSSPLPDCWTMLAALCTRISQWMDTTDNKHSGVIQKPHFMTDKPNAQEMQSQRESPWQAFVLPEEAATEGFSPMQDAIPQIVYYRKDIDTAAISDYIRLDKMALFGDFLSGIEPAVLQYELQQQEYRSLIPIEASERQHDGVSTMDSAANQLVLEQGCEQVQDMLKQLLEEEEAVVVNVPTNSNGDNRGGLREYDTLLSESTATPDARILALQRRRNDLLKEQRFYQDQEVKRQSAIQSAMNRRCLELHVFPVYLVADTNCYIDHLPGIQALCHSQYFTIVIPLVVINELDYLSQLVAPEENSIPANIRVKQAKPPKGAANNVASASLLPEHFTVEHLDMPHSVMLRRNAQTAIKWLEEQFEMGNHKLKAMSSDGKPLHNIQFRTEAFERNGRKNDDIILECCQHFVHDKAKDFVLKDKEQAIRLHREMVLLTGDRNLRLKALAANIPVRPLKPFLRWAKVKL